MCISWTNKGFDTINMHGRTMKTMKIIVIVFVVVVVVVVVAAAAVIIVVILIRPGKSLCDFKRVWL